jgi:hypothetical protein
MEFEFGWGYERHKTSIETLTPTPSSGNILNLENLYLA